MEAKVMMIKCQKNRKAFGARIQKEGPNWRMTWAIKGSFIFDEEYPGCPHCGAQSFFTCGKCGKITCWDGSDTATCAWCGNKSKIQLVNELEVKGGGF